MSAIKISMLGSGAIAEEHIKVFSAMKDVKVAGICSRTLEKAQRLSRAYQIDFTTTSIQDLYKNTKSHILIVAIPILELKNVIEEICRYEWSIFLEKPAGIDYEECSYINDLSKLHNKHIFVGHNRRFLPSLTTVKALLESESTQKVARFISIRDCQDTELARKFGHSETLIKKWMFANSIHLIDLFYFFSQSEIEYIKIIKKFDISNPKLTVSYLKYKNGDEGLYECVWNTAGVWGCAISTPHTFYEMSPLEHAHFKHRGSCKFITHTDINKGYKPGFYEQALSLISQLREQKSNITTLEQSLKTMKLIKLLYGEKENAKIFL